MQRVNDLDVLLGLAQPADSAEDEDEDDMDIEWEEVVHENHSAEKPPPDNRENPAESPGGERVLTLEVVDG